MVNHAESKARARGFNGDVNSRIKGLFLEKRFNNFVLLEAASPSSLRIGSQKPARI